MKFPIANFTNKPYPSGDVIQYYGEHPELYHIQKNHCGWDIIPNDVSQAYGQPIYAMYDSLVIEIGGNANTSYGNAVRTINDEGLINIYGHNSKVLVSVGQRVKEGDKIAEMGNTGFVVSSTPSWSTNPYAGTHLHVTFIPTKPVQAGDPPGPTFSFPGTPALRFPYYDNGNQGAVNPAPYFAGLDGKPLPLPRDLQRGDTGLDVENLQTILWLEGLLDRADVIGQYGPKTQTAVFAFQRRYNLVSAFNIYRGRYCAAATRAKIREIGYV
jgi:peptidoglycan hydrolase-like protein with peptidoglycan-binding domain